MTTFEPSMIEAFEANPDVTILDRRTVDGDEVVVLLDTMGSDPQVLAYTQPKPGYMHAEYEARLSQKYGYGSEPGPWGVNIQSSGPWNSVERARLAEVVLHYAIREAVARNAKEA